MAYSSALFHFVFRTKHSFAAFKLSDLSELFKYIAGICENQNCKLIWINGMSDHIHMAVGLSPNISYGDFMREVKRSSSVWMKDNREKFPKFRGWAKGYFAATFSHRDIDKVVNISKISKLIILV